MRVPGFRTISTKGLSADTGPPSPEPGFTSSRREAPVAAAFPARHVDSHHDPLNLTDEVQHRSRELGMVPLPFLHWNPALAHVASRIASHRRFLRVKRAIDLVLAALLGLLALPLVPFILIGIRLDSPGPILTARTRLGQGNRPFRMYGFRCTWQDTDETAKRTARETMVTPFGRVLRQSHLEAVPQLWNVLRGDMSIVGPCPLSPRVMTEMQAIIPEFALRTSVKPGMTGWAETCIHGGISEEALRMRLAYDLYYIDFDCPRLETAILLRKLKTLVGHGGRWRPFAEDIDEQDVPGPVRVADSGTEPSTEPARVLATPSDRAPRQPSHGRGYFGVVSLRGGGADGAPDPGARALILGAGERGRVLAGLMRGGPMGHPRPIGFLDDDAALHGEQVIGLPVFGAVSALPMVLPREDVDLVIDARPAIPPDAARAIADVAQRFGAQVIAAPMAGAGRRGVDRLGAPPRFRPEDVLGRPQAEPDRERCSAFIKGKRVLITGAAGSIGQELGRQVLALEPATLILVDINESDLFDRDMELRMQSPEADIRSRVLSITDAHHLHTLFAETRPQIVFHAAAYKHVPFMEHEPDEAVRTNVLGTKTLAETAARFHAERFVMVSTDKAVHPTSAMGASKRIAELVVFDIANHRGLPACAVRFGNVLGSRGSVLPIFERQIAAGGPVTVTDKEMRRYFMTIPEAAGLIIQSGAFGEGEAIYMLDMGADVSILELAERVIRLHGLTPYEDIPIVFTGIRPGEKLREELANEFEAARTSPHPRIRMLTCRMNPADHPDILERLADLTMIAGIGEPEDIRAALLEFVRWADEREQHYVADIDHAGRSALATGYH